MENELRIKSVLGEQLADEEVKKLKNRNAKYELVRFLYIEKMKSIGVNLAGFQFTPGQDFENTPTIDVVNALINIHVKIESGEYQPLNFGDRKWVHNPPHTGLKKIKLYDD